MYVVIVDSSRVVLQILEKTIQERGDNVKMFTDGREAYDYIKENQDVDVLLTSFELKSMSGLELCWETRALSQNRSKPIYVIAMSSIDDQHKLVEALDSGADDYIQKPPSAEEFKARLRAAGRLTSLQNELIRLATIDPLTSIYNRRAFFDKSTQAIEAAKTSKSLYGIMFDIDHFKRVNDTYGHDIGDIAIQQVSSLASSYDGVVGRLGGEEFSLVMSDIEKDDVIDAVEALRENISQIQINTEKGILSFTCSFGVTGMLDGDDIHAILKRADMALYQAKESGRNKVVYFEQVCTA